MMEVEKIQRIQVQDTVEEDRLVASRSSKITPWLHLFLMCSVYKYICLELSLLSL